MLFPKPPQFATESPCHRHACLTKASYNIAYYYCACYGGKRIRWALESYFIALCSLAVGVLGQSCPFVPCLMHFGIADCLKYTYIYLRSPLPKENRTESGRG